MRNGVDVPLGGRAMDLLLHLAAHAGAIVSKDALLQAVWPDRVVEENNLTVHMASLRRALGETTGGPRVIQTVTGRGYIFTGAGATAPRVPEPAVPTPDTAPPRSRLAAPVLIGRDAAVEELRDLLRIKRLVTIVGPGGVGKTSLALRAAADSETEFSDGAAFADLSGITDPARVPEVVAAVLAAGAGDNSATDRLTAFLRGRHALLVLDNCERLVEPVAVLVGAILSRCPRVVILATSREGLYVAQERIFRLPPLSFPPDPHHSDAATALTFDAVRLFAERAASVEGFALTDAAAPVVATICARLDGIPLAIEMAVPRLKVLSLAQLAERLDERFRLLATPGRGATPRHRTLRAMIDWSYDFLPVEEQTLLRALSVFPGGADLAAIQAIAGEVAGDEFELLDRLTGLVDKSLLTVDTAVTPRFRLLETVRQYAAEKLLDAGEAALRLRHAAYFTGRLAEASAKWPVTQGPGWLAAYANDADNVRGALGWAFGPDGDPATGIRLAANSVPLWWELPETPLAEGQRWFDMAAGRLDAETPAATRGWLRFGQSWRDFRFGDLENLPLAMEAASLFRASGEMAGVGAALWRAGSAALTSETSGQAEAHLVEAETVLRGVPAGKWLALTLVRLGDVRFRQGRLAMALASYQEGFALSRRFEFWIGLVNGGSNMAELLYAQGETDRALQQLRGLRDELPPSRRTPLMATLTAHLLLAGAAAEMRVVADEAISQGAAIGLTASLAWAVEAVALHTAMSGDFDNAARLSGYARRVHPSVATRAGSRKALVERLDQILTAKLPPDVLSAARADGGLWDARTAAERALLSLR